MARWARRIGRHLAVACIVAAGLVAAMAAVVLLAVLGFRVGGEAGLFCALVAALVGVVALGSVLDDSPFFTWAGEWPRR